MSRAEELLDSLTEEQIMMYGVNPVDEPHIVIESDKTITVPDDLRHIAVQGEHNIETVTFDSPRYWDGHDLSQMQMRIVYQRPDGHREPHLVENLRVDEADENTIHFDWTISGNVTAVKGNISFMVCAKLSDSEGNREREWHTRLSQDLVVDEGMECSGEEIVEQNPDIIEAILVQLDDLKNASGVSDEQVANAVAAYLEENPIDPGNDQQTYVAQDTAPENTNTLWIDTSDDSSDSNSGQNVNNPWNGKRWLCIGDSITTEGGVYANVGYGKLISSDLGMELTNIAVSGKTAAWGCEVLDSCAEDYDLITVMLGTNDHGYACPIGSLNDDYYIAGDYTSSGSFYARMQLLVEKLQAKYPKSPILMLTPIKRTAVNPAYSNIANNDAGYQINMTLKLTTEAYRNAVIDVCEYYSVPYVDLYNTIDPRTEANRELYFMSADDGTHPNDLGHALKLAPVIKAGILAHTPYVFPVWDDSGDSGGDDSGGDDSGDTTAPVLIHAYGLGVKGETIEDTVGDCDMTASGEMHGVHCNEGTWNLTRGESFSFHSKATRNTKYYRVSHRITTGARSGLHVTTGGSTYDMTGRFEFGLGAPEGVTATNGNAVVQFYYLTAHDSTAKSEPIYGSKIVAPGDTVELALTFDAVTSTVRLYQDGELIAEEVTSVPLAVDGLNVYGNWAAELPTDASLGACPCEYIELYRDVITV